MSPKLKEHLLTVSESPGVKNNHLLFKNRDGYQISSVPLYEIVH
jgi:hypothetical protein